MIRTRLTTLLGIEHPIIQGGMAWTATAELAAAVSNAGGLGVIGAGHMPTDLLREQIRNAKAATDRPFGVNLMLLTPHIDELVQMVLDEGVRVVTTGAGNPGKYMADFKERGIKVLPIAPSVALAKRLESIGADAIIGEGMEAGGHIGELTTMVLTPQLVDAVGVPVVAAGGIADGRGVAAAFALGAEGVQVGTRFMCAEECTIHPDIKARIIKARDRDTVVTGYSTGHPVRVIKNKLSRMIEELDRDNKPEEIEVLGTGRLALAMREGDLDMGSLMAGQAAAMVRAIEPAETIVRTLVEEAEAAMRALPSVCGG
ncbi:MAG: enoyl-[acyl-carrier-protein] reductase FabK [Coriobacteriia bacterium]|nr:enoyl-[acyl-carrier-protein] reductase FabK [Actinomycetota bacterium]MDZ4167565.1 enoyl-[acyl-carrier-protein] reductase FabK [Coriobacteriia bacterium]